MKKSHFADSQILSILKQAENGVPVPELCREHGMSGASFHKWSAKFGGMGASMMVCLKELEDENRRLKKMYAEERLKSDILKEAMERNRDRSILYDANQLGAIGDAEKINLSRFWSLFPDQRSQNT